MKGPDTPERAIPGAAKGAPRSLDQLLLDWRGGLRRATGYLSALGIAAGEREEIARRAVARAAEADHTGDAVAQVLDRLPELLRQRNPLADGDENGHDGFWRWRLAWWWSAPPVKRGATLRAPAVQPVPPLLRGSMVPERYGGHPLGSFRRHRRSEGPGARGPGGTRREAPRPWRRAGRLRRLLLALLVVVPSAAAGFFMLEILPAPGPAPIEVVVSAFFGALFGWISLGFWTAVFGFFVLVRGGDRFAVTRAQPPHPEAPIDPDARVAIVMPVCDEDVTRVFAGLRSVRRSLYRTGELDRFDFFVLSDTTGPDAWVDEEQAWAEWRRAADEGGGIFYRRRRVRHKRKSGNVADFCRRFGRRYRYMVVLDADSVMSGGTLLRLVRLMEQHPHVGIVQTAPRVVRARSLFARTQQFASRLYGPMFAAGMHFWQLGDSPYWGHNAILRIEPFMRHCGLPRLSGRPPLGGDILSHDFVEAALLGRAGWSIWLAFDLGGSFEETPESLLGEMQRDRRWCQGNLQHLRLLFTEGVYATHRALFLNGVFAYVSALLWLAFLAASTAEAVLWAVRGPDYFPTGPTLHPTWPVWRPEWAAWMVGIVAVVLFLPKILPLGLVVARRQAKAFGGAARLTASVLGETLASALLAPIRMVFYCRFVLANLVGRAVSWREGDEEGGETRWSTALVRHGPDTLFATAWAVAVRALHPEVFWWLLPVAGALIVSIPLSVLASRRTAGDRARALGLFVTPEERDPPREVADLEIELGAQRAAVRGRATGFVRAVVDPGINALHEGLLRGPRSLASRIDAVRRALAERALSDGPDALDDSERRILLSDPARMHDLHVGAWRLDVARARRWGLAPPDSRQAPGAPPGGEGIGSVSP